MSHLAFVDIADGDALDGEHGAHLGDHALQLVITIGKGLVLLLVAMLPLGIGLHGLGIVISVVRAYTDLVLLGLGHDLDRFLARRLEVEYWLACGSYMEQVLPIVAEAVLERVHLHAEFLDEVRVFISNLCAQAFFLTSAGLS